MSQRVSRLKKSLPHPARLRPQYLEFTIRVYPNLGYELQTRKPYKTRSHGPKA